MDHPYAPSCQHHVDLLPVSALPKGLAIDTISLSYIGIDRTPSQHLASAQASLHSYEAAYAASPRGLFQPPATATSPGTIRQRCVKYAECKGASPSTMHRPVSDYGRILRFEHNLALAAGTKGRKKSTQVGSGSELGSSGP